MPQKLLFVFLLLLSSRLFAQDAGFFKPDSARRRIEAVKILTSIHVDGILNEPEWSLAKPSIRFTQVEPLQGKPSNFMTEVKVLYNKQNLYILEKLISNRISTIC